MNKFFLIIFLTIYTSVVVGQEKNIDPKYLEDQIYFGVTNNTFVSTPKGFKQNGFSYGISLGFIKDIPFNSERNIGLGVGLGYSFNAYNNNLLVNKVSNTDVLSISEDYDTNLWTTSTVDIPFEFRWRTSSLEKYKFWRIYSGMKFSYIFSHRSKYVFEGVSNLNKNIQQLQKFQYGVYTSMGFNTWNFYIYYSLSNLLNSDAVTDKMVPVELSPLKIGLMFYIL